MSAPNDGGSAFPHPGYHGVDGKFVDVPHVGMTLRDWFAGQALAGFCANPVGISNWSPDGIAQDAYKIADSMLVERTVEEVKP
jgi:hypothetical protein